MSKIRFVGLDVHAETIAAAVAESEGEVERLEGAIDEVVKSAPAEMQAVIGALQALRGIAQLSAVTILSELGAISRFQAPRQLMGYSGLVASEHSSGERSWRGGITRTGNAHLRRVVIEAAWAYRHRPSVGGLLHRRQEKLSTEVKEIAWKAQHRVNIRVINRRDSHLGRHLCCFARPK